MTKLISLIKTFEEKLDRETQELYAEDAPSNVEALKKKTTAAYLQLGKSMFDAGRFKEGLALARKAIQISPADLNANYFLLTKMERLNQVEEAWAALLAFEKQCGSLYDTDKELYLLKARLEHRRGNLETAREMLEKFLAENPFHSLNIHAYWWLGKLLDTMGDYDAAMLAFHEHNNRNACTPDGLDMIQKSRTAFANLDTSLSWYGNKHFSTWRKTIIFDQLPPPVLVVGFPRSGTTLLGQILSSHPALITLEEMSTLSGIKEKFHGNEDSLLSLSLLNSQELSACRQSYWSNIAKLLDKPVDEFTVIDKLPLNIRYLDIFARLFPEVKVVVALRDPRDVVLSNYMQMYKLNPEMATSLNLVDCARFYAKVMELYLLFRESIPGNIHEIRYEDLVCDFQVESTKLLEFLGFDWNSELVRYHENAKKRYIRTPSYDQVTKPIYRDAIGRWKNYQTHLKEIKPLLQPYIEAFGYST